MSDPLSESLPRNRAILRVIGRVSSHLRTMDQPSCKPSDSRRASAVHRAIRRASRCRRAAYEPVFKLQAGRQLIGEGDGRIREEF